METDEDMLSAAWLRPLLELVQQGNFVEAEALAEYFPNSPGRQLVQCVALLAQRKQLARAEALAQALSSTHTMQRIAAAFVAVLEKNDIDLPGFAKESLALEKHPYVEYPYLTSLCLEAHVLLHPEAGHQVGALYIQFGKIARGRGQYEQYEKCFLRALSLAGNLQEFLAFERASARLLFFFDNLAIISQAKWYSQAKEDDLLGELSSFSPGQRKQNWVALLGRLSLYAANPLVLPWLAPVLQSMFSQPLALNQHDAQHLKELSPTLPASLQDIIQKGLSSQTIVAETQLPIGSTFGENEQFGFPTGWREFLTSPSSANPPAHTGGQPEWIRLGQPPLSASGQPEPSVPSSSSQLVSRGDDEWPRGVSIEQIEPLEQIEQKMQVERHTRVDFPSACVLEQRVELKIQLTRSVPFATRVLEKIMVAVGAEEKEIALDVHLTAANFALRQSHQKLALPLDGDSEELAFTLVPLETGNQVVEVEFFHGSSRVGYILVTTNVRKGYSFAPAPLNVFPLEDPLAGLENASAPPHARRTLHVSWLEHEGKLSYTIYSEDADEFGEWEQNGPDTKEQITEYLREFNALLTEAVVQGKPTDEAWESTLLNLQSVCRHLFVSLVPPQIAQSMQAWEPGSAVIISTNEQWIPWEILYDGRSFWGERFIVARHPRLSDRRSLPFTHRANGGGSRTIRKIVNVIGGEIPANEAQRAAMLFGQFPPERVTLLKEAPVAALQKVLPDADILHCTCHGYLEPHMLRIARDKSRVQNLLPETIETLSLEEGSLVFVNACSSTAPVLTFGKFSSFGWEFYRRGVGVFLGTLGAIPTKYAVSFAETVYEEMLRKDARQTLGQAVAAAKKKAARERNLFWLLYCIYGDPDFSMQAP